MTLEMIDTAILEVCLTMTVPIFRPIYHRMPYGRVHLSMILCYDWKVHRWVIIDHSGTIEKNIFQSPTWTCFICNTKETWAGSDIHIAEMMSAEKLRRLVAKLDLQ